MIDSIYIDDIDFSSCSSDRKDFSSHRRVFRSLEEGRFYKVWTEGLMLWGNDIGANFLNCLRSGFYEGISEIETVILAPSGRCVGYATRPFNKIGDLKMSPNDHGFKVFEDADKQNGHYKKLFSTLCERTKAHKYLFYDLTETNIIENNRGDYRLIDCESVIPLRNMHDIPSFHISCLPKDYSSFVSELYSETGIDTALIKEAWTMSTGGMDRKPYYGVVINGHNFEGERPWADRWSLIKPAMNWEGLRVLDLGTCMAMVPAFLIKFCGVKSAVGIDFNPYHLKASDLVLRAFRTPQDRVQLLCMDLDKDDYETKLGDDFDVVFCLSFLRWIKDKKRLLNYLSNFQNIVLEPHDLDGNVLSLFETIGFTESRHLGTTRIGSTFSDKRDLYLFSK